MTETPGQEQTDGQGGEEAQGTDISVHQPRDVAPWLMAWHLSGNVVNRPVAGLSERRVVIDAKSTTAQVQMWFEADAFKKMIEALQTLVAPLDTGLEIPGQTANGNKLFVPGGALPSQAIRPPGT